MMSNNFTEPRSVKNVWRNVAVAVFAAVFALIGLGVTLFPSRAADDSCVTVGEIYGQADNVQQLYDLITGKVNATYADVVAKAKTTNNFATMRADNGDQTFKVTFGGKEWYAVYLSQTNETNPRPILTLWLCESFTEDVWNITGNAQLNTYPNAMYGTSYVRTKILNNAGQYSTDDGKTLNNTVMPDANHPLARFSVPTADMALTDLIVKPALVEWQRAGQVCPFPTNVKNENWDEKRTTGWAAGHNYSNIAEYGAWKDDYLWLPSVCECTNYWDATACISEGICVYWTRTGDEASHCVIRTIGHHPAGTVTYRNVTEQHEIHPALHLDLQTLNAMTDFANNELAAINVVYDGNDHQIANLPTKPDWYNDGMQITYTQNGVDVTTVKDAGEYTVTVQWGNVTRTTTLTVAPKAVNVDTTTIKAKDRTYNRERGVELEPITVNGIITGDTVTVNSNGIMDDKNAGEIKAVNVTVSLTGADAKNYVLTESRFTTEVNIACQTVTVEGITVEDKEYDNTARAVFNTRSVRFTGLIPGDDLTVAVHGEYGQSTVGDNLTVTLQSLVLDGNDANNYTIANGSQKEVTGCRIKPRVITVTIDDQTVKVGDPQKPLTARVTSGSLAGDDQADTVYRLSLLAPEGELAVGEYKIIGEEVDNANYHVTFANDGKYRVLTVEEWEALQANEEVKEDNHLWLIIIIVIAVAAFIGALVGVGLVIRSRDKNREPKPQKEKK